jgi:16S rRNA (uracil1498-N3)-methyltransferase
MQLFFTPDITSNNYTLKELESKHCIRVLRMSKGDTLYLTDGVGNLYRAEIEYDNHKACRVKIIEKFQDFEKRDYYIHIAIAPTKSIDRFEWFLEKATEIGIDEITPMLTERSERKMVKYDRLEKIVISAMKQSIKTYKPKINHLVNFSELIKQPKIEEVLCIAHCNEGEKVKIQEIYTKAKSCMILIGPEGDFTPEEVAQASLSGFKQTTLGVARLRTETAGLVACHSVGFINQ